MPYYTLTAKFKRENSLRQTEIGERVATHRYARSEDEARSAYALQVVNNEPGIEVDSLEIEVHEEA